MGGVGALIRSVVAGACNGSKIISGMVGYVWYNMGTDWAHEKLPERSLHVKALADALRQLLLVAESSTVSEIQSELLLSQARTARHSSRNWEAAKANPLADVVLSLTTRRC
eukprot:17099-Heterococcus_DN1.PRE.1